MEESLKRYLPWLVAVSFFMEALDATILNTAVPVMANALGVVPLSMKSVLSSYTLSLAVFIPVSSWVADRFGTRRVFASAIGLFVLGSLLCGLARDIRMMVAFRILQGCGGAMMVPVGRLTLVRAFPKSELVNAMTFVAIPALVGPMLGPLAGGLIVHYLHWRMIFFVNLPIGFIGLYFVLRYLPDFYGETKVPLDFVGLVLFGSGLALLSYVLEVFGEHTLSIVEMSALLALSATLLAAYVLHARGLLHPLLRLELLRVRTLQAAVGGTFFTRLGAGGMPFLLPLLYQVGLGYSPVQSGLLILPQTLAALALRYWVPRILGFFGYRRLLLANTALIGLSIISFTAVGEATGVGLIVALACGLGFASAMQYSSLNTLGYADVSDADSSQASTILSTVQQLSLSFGVATSSLVTALFVPDRFRSGGTELILGLHRAFVLLGLLTIVSSLGFTRLKPSDGENISARPKAR